MNTRLYDAKLHRFLAPDNFIQDPSNSQNYNRYGYVLNNPLKFTDPSGEIAFAPILVGMAYGAIIGAATSAVVYSATALINQQWNWNSFGKSVLFGAVGGAIGGGLSGLASGTTSSFLQSTTYNMLSEVASQVGANAIMGNDITFGTVLGSMAGGFVGAKMGQWSAVEGGTAINIIGEIGYNSVKGGARGAIAGGVGSAIDGDNIKNGIYRGTINGMLGGAIQTTAMISTFGHTYKPSEEQLSYVKAMSEKYGVDYNSIAYRKGGLYQLVQSAIKNEREVVWGRNIVTFGKKTTPETMGHEFGHIIQAMKLYGWSVFQRRGIFEQLLWGAGAYNPYLHPNSIEVEADKLLYLNY